MKVSSALVVGVVLGTAGFQPPDRHFAAPPPQNKPFSTEASIHVEAEFTGSGEASLVVRAPGLNLKRNGFQTSPEPLLVNLSRPMSKIMVDTLDVIRPGGKRMKMRRPEGPRVGGHHH